MSFPSLTIPASTQGRAGETHMARVVRTSKAPPTFGPVEAVGDVQLRLLSACQAALADVAGAG